MTKERFEYLFKGVVSAYPNAIKTIEIDSVTIIDQIFSSKLSVSNNLIINHALTNVNFLARSVTIRIIIADIVLSAYQKGEVEKINVY